MALALDLAAALDPVVFAERAGLEPDDWQQRVIRSAAHRILLNCSRQSGKSTMAALVAVHASVYEPGSLSLLLSPTQRQSGELFKKCLAIYRGVGRPVPAEAESALFLGLENGSRIVCLPGREGTVRGYSGVRLLVIDEAAWVPSELYASVRPMLAVSGGRLICLSTPHGNRGWWYEAWRGDEPWDRYEISASLCPRISPAFLEEERRELGEWWFQQEYECRFLDAESQAFRSEDIARAFAERVDVWPL
jgi:hypothetical protein